MQPLLNLPFMKKPAGGKSEQPAHSSVSPASPTDDEVRLKLYKLIIERYRDKIEEYETKSVSELKSLIQPHDQKITSLRDSITAEFHPYVYEEHFLEAAKSAFAHISSFRTIPAPVSFWLSFPEMQEIMAGDEIDKSIVLCSLLRSLGSESAKVFVTDTRNSYVLFQFSSKSYVADHSQRELLEFDSGQNAMQCLKGRILYSINDREYEDFQEG
ncbi:TPA: hypothetical protein HA225_04890 [Candidatus Micrarchaeota archaeon]|nr:hypothetical protein [Candidatus Micrarchaeota archaeon]